MHVAFYNCYVYDQMVADISKLKISYQPFSSAWCSWCEQLLVYLCSRNTSSSFKVKLLLNIFEACCPHPPDCRILILYLEGYWSNCKTLQFYYTTNINVLNSGHSGRHSALPFVSCTMSFTLITIFRIVSCTHIII